MIKQIAKLLLLFAGFFFAAILQASFFSYFSISGATPNIIFSLFFLVVFSADKKNHLLGFFTCIVAGFFLDLVSSFYFGTSILALLIIYALHHFLSHIVHRHENLLVLNFTVAFCAFLALYDVLLYLFSLVSNISFLLNAPLVISVAYSLLFAIAGFLIIQPLVSARESNNQLKLF